MITFIIKDAFDLAFILEENKAALLPFADKLADFNHKVGIVTTACCDNIKEGRLKFLNESYLKLITVIKEDKSLQTTLKQLTSCDRLTFEQSGAKIEEV